MRELRPEMTPSRARIVSPLLSTRDLSLTANGNHLIKDITLDIAPGRKTLILGPNGAGKSLLLRLMHGLLAPTSGDVLWNGTPLSKPARRAQAMVFQKPVMLRRSTIANLRFALRLCGLSGSERRQREAHALDMAGLSHLANRPARVLSGGEQQRLAIARALAMRPELLFLDEPTANLDPASTRAIETLINTAHADGVSIVMVTHDTAQARRLADDVIFLNHGRVVESGPAARMLTAPRTPAAQAWLDGTFLEKDIL